MQLTDLEKALSSIILTMVGTCILYIKAAYGKVSKKECENHREILKEGCPINRRVLSIEDHDRLCASKIQPIQSDIQETKQGIIKLHEKIDLILIQTAGRNK